MKSEKEKIQFPGQAETNLNLRWKLNVLETSHQYVAAHI